MDREINTAAKDWLSLAVNCGGPGGTPGPCDVIPDAVPVGRGVTKVKVPKVVKPPKPPKVKKLTKKELEAREKESKEKADREAKQGFKDEFRHRPGESRGAYRNRLEEGHRSGAIRRDEREGIDRHLREVPE